MNLSHHQLVSPDEDDHGYVTAADALCAERGQPLPAAVAPEIVARARRVLATLTRWQATTPGETLRLAFPLGGEPP